MIKKFIKNNFSKRIISWQISNGRKNLPWQKTNDPYHIWLSEIMLQQTQVSVVIPYFHRFLEKFPDLNSLAKTDLNDVMLLWSGLGYYRRAKNLHLCAKKIVSENKGYFPSQKKLLQNLPGIGISTAGAIAVFAFGKRESILDGNVKRVMCRNFGIEGYPRNVKVEKKLWDLAENLLPSNNIKIYTQGLMDLGAMVCIRGVPKCNICPLSDKCIALKDNRIKELPFKKQKKIIEKFKIMFIFLHNDLILLEKKPIDGVWGGLFSFPEISYINTSEELAFKKFLKNTSFGVIKEFEKLSKVECRFTHYSQTILPIKVSLSKKYKIINNLLYKWVKIKTLNQEPLPSPIRKITDSLEKL